MKNEGKIWTDQDYEILKQYYPLYGSEYCAELLERHKKAIVSKATKKKIKFTGVRYKYSKENLEPIVRKSKNLREVLDNMKLRAAGGNYKVIKSYIEKYAINTSHFETAAERMLKQGKQNIAIPLLQVMIENSNYSRTDLKRRLYTEGLKKRECELCGQGELWKGKKMSLILDHKNGVYNDNRLENIRIVCPNCNATLDTHCGKHNRKIIVEKKEKYKDKNKKEVNGVDGRQRAGVERRRFVRPSLEQLKKEVEDFGYSGTGRRYGVSDNSIRKWIKTYEQYGK